MRTYKKFRSPIIKSTYLILLFTIFLTTQVGGQNLAINSQLMFNGIDDLNDSPVDIISTSDCGTLILMNIESFLTSSDIVLKKFDGFNNLVWTYTFPNNGIDISYKLILDNSQNIFIAANSDSFNTGGQDLIVISLNQNGIVRWIYNENINTNLDDVPLDIFVTSNNTVFVCGNYGSQSGFVRSLSNINGGLINSYNEFNTLSGWSSTMLKILETSNNVVIILNGAVLSGIGRTNILYFNSITGTNNGFSNWSNCWNCGESYPIDFCKSVSGDIFIVGERIRNGDTCLNVQTSQNFNSDFYTVPFSSLSASKGLEILFNHNGDLIVFGEFDSDTISTVIDKTIRILRFNSSGLLLNNASIGALDGINQHFVTARKSTTSVGSISILYENKINSTINNRILFKLNSTFNPLSSIQFNQNGMGLNLGEQLAIDTYDNILCLGMFEKPNNTTDVDFFKLTSYNFSNSLNNTGINQLTCSYNNSPVYYWFLNNSPFDTSTTNYLSINQSGNYSCVFLRNCILDTVYFNNAILGITSILNENEIILSPNPFIENFGIKSNRKISQIIIYNIYGQKVEEFLGVNQTQFEVNLVNHPAGVYLVQIVEENKTIVKKIIKE